MTQVSCSFCGKHRADVRKLISGPSVFICDECVSLCNSILDEGDGAAAKKCPKPLEIYRHLDRYVIGQDRAKRVLSVAVYNHYKRVYGRRRRPGDVTVSKGNVLLIGPTGCGKTLLAQSLARKLDVPFAIVDATALTEAGYVGEDVESVVKAIYRAAGGDVERAGRGIIYLDEIDKLSRRGGGPSTGRDVSGEGVQQALLKLLEGRKASITPDGSRGRPQQERVQIDTTNILFICSGSFEGLEDFVSQRSGNKSIGFGAQPEPQVQDSNALRSRVQHEDLVRFGLIPEFVGRVPILVPCDELDIDALVEVLWRPKNALVRQYQRLLQMEGVDLRATSSGLRAIASDAYRRRAGARGLRAVMEEVMLDLMYELPSLEGIAACVLDEEAVQNRAPVKVIAEQKAS